MAEKKKQPNFEQSPISPPSEAYSLHVFWRHKTKRAFDFIVVIMALIFFLPQMVFIALLIRFTMGKPVLFRQYRPGLNGKGFTLYKFRTMEDKKDADQKILPDAARLTSVGKILRSLSLDELPELFNVLKGDMSIVGPRPLLLRYLERYDSEQMRRHEVKPGITGWAQIHGRNALDWEERFKLDVWYVDNWSLWLDIRIILITICKIIKREGINQPGQATMKEFKETSK